MRIKFTISGAVILVLCDIFTQYLLQYTKSTAKQNASQVATFLDICVHLIPYFYQTLIITSSDKHVRLSRGLRFKSWVGPEKIIRHCDFSKFACSRESPVVSNVQNGRS